MGASFSGVIRVDSKERVSEVKINGHLSEETENAYSSKSFFLPFHFFCIAFE